MKFKVLKKCYYGEGENKPRLMYPGEFYESLTLKAKDAPKYLEAVGKQKEAPKAPKAPAKPVEPKDEELGLDYQEMKTFVTDNEIEVKNQKKETLIEAIKAFKAAESESDESEGEGEGEGEQESTEE